MKFWAVVFTAFFVGQVGLAQADRAPRAAIALLAPGSGSLQGDIVEVLDVQKTQAEAAFAVAEAAVYVSREGRVRLFVPEGSTSAPAMFRRSNRIESQTLTDFLTGLDRDLPGLLEGRQGPYVLKTPAAVDGLEMPGRPRASAATPQYVSGIVFSDSFESGFLTSSWNLYSSTSSYSWAAVTCEARSGAYSADAVRGGASGPYLTCSSPYPNSITTYMTHAGCENILGAPQAWLDVYTHLNTENGYDTIGFFYPDPSVPGRLVGYAYSGSSSGWFHVVLNLRQFYRAGDLTQNPCNQATVYFYSDSTGAPGFGARVDDLAVRTDTPSFLRASINASSLSGPTPLMVNFSAQVSGALGAVSYFWDFGVPGASSTLPNPTYTFVSPGTYNVLLRASDASGDSFADVTVLVGASAPPVTSIPQVDTSSCPVVKAICSVTDSSGTPIQGLTTSNFVLREDGIQKTFTATPIGSSGNFLSAAINIDNSGSLSTSDFASEKTAAKTFVNLLAANDQIAIYGFANTPSLVQDFTTNKSLLNAVLDGYGYIGGSTALYESLFQSLTSTGMKPGRRAVIVMTDGEDNSSQHSQTDVVNLAHSLGIPIYAIGFGQANATVLQSLASQTGGLYFSSPSPANLQQILVSIGNNINSQYQLSYTSTAAAGVSHTLQVVTTTSSGTSSATKSFMCQSQSQTCTPGGPNLCLTGNRFRVQVNWRNPYDGGSTGVGTSVPFTSDTGCFWFFTSSNLELILKILDGRASNGKFWVFYGALSDVEYTITITDTQTGLVRQYYNPPRNLASVADINAF